MSQWVLLSFKLKWIKFSGTFQGDMEGSQGRLLYINDHCSDIWRIKQESAWDDWKEGSSDNNVNFNQVKQVGKMFVGIIYIEIFSEFNRAFWWGLSDGNQNMHVYTHACMLSHFSCVRLFVTLWTVAHQDPLSMGFSRQKYWSGLLCPPPENLPNPGSKSESPALQVDFLLLSHWWSPETRIGRFN